MRKVALVGSLSLLFLLPQASSWSLDSGDAKESSFDVEIIENLFVENVDRDTETSVPETTVVENSSSVEAVQIIYFQQSKDPKDKRPQPQIGGGMKPGDYCLTHDGKVGTFGYLPYQPNSEIEDYYIPNDRVDTLSCIPFTDAELEAANLEVATGPDGQLVLRSARISLTVQDLASFPITPATIHQQNPPHTLKNYHTNFWADPNPQEFTTVIAGRQVQVRATPVLYTFDYGDGTSKTTTNPGYRLGEDVWDEETPTSHQYQEARDFTFQLTTTYRGEYSVEGGPWQVIDGTVEQTGEGQLVRVWQTKVGLVAGDR